MDEAILQGTVKGTERRGRQKEMGRQHKILDRTGVLSEQLKMELGGDALLRRPLCCFDNHKG